jgi:hypothetical protein
MRLGVLGEGQGGLGVAVSSGGTIGGATVGGPSGIMTVNPCPPGYMLTDWGAPGVCVPINPADTGVTSVDVTYGPQVCLDNNGQYTNDLSQCVNAPVYQSAGGIPCLVGQGPLQPGQVMCATGCGSGQAWDPITGTCKDMVTPAEWIPGVSNGIVMGVAALLGVLLLAGGGGGRRR